MKKLGVYADFDWLKEIELIGELSYENLRGSETFGFKYADEWLKKHADLYLSNDINNYPGQQYTQPGKDIFGCFSDALPDRWGRMLLDKRERIFAFEEAARIIDEVVKAVSKWRPLAIKLQLPKSEIDYFSSRFDMSATDYQR